LGFISVTINGTVNVVNESIHSNWKISIFRLS